MLRDLLNYANVSNRKVAVLLGCNERTVRNWLEGISQPDPSTLIKLFRVLDVPMMPFIADRSNIKSSEKDKQEILYYINNKASAEELETMNFNLNCKHGSSVASQLTLVSMLNHMELRYRLLIAKMVVNLWEIASESNGLQNTSEAMPNVQKVHDAIVKSHNALQNGRNSYTDI